MLIRYRMQFDTSMMHIDVWLIVSCGYYGLVTLPVDWVTAANDVLGGAELKAVDCFDGIAKLSLLE